MLIHRIFQTDSAKKWLTGVSSTATLASYLLTHFWGQRVHWDSSKEADLLVWTLVPAGKTAIVRGRGEGLIRVTRLKVNIRVRLCPQKLAEKTHTGCKRVWGILLGQCCIENSRKRGFYFTGKRSRKQIMSCVHEIKKCRCLWPKPRICFTMTLLRRRCKKTFFQ